MYYYVLLIYLTISLRKLILVKNNHPKSMSPQFTLPNLTYQ